MDFATANGFEVLGLTYSPIRGPEGNIEYLVHLRKMPKEEFEEAMDTEDETGENDTSEERNAGEKETYDEAFVKMAKNVVALSHNALEH